MTIYEVTNNLISGAFLKCFSIVKPGCVGVWYSESSASDEPKIARVYLVARKR